MIYADTIRQAFREASDALVGHAKARELRAELERLATAAQDARRLADIRYRGGAASYLEVLDADTRLFTAELRLAEAQEGELVSFVENLPRARRRLAAGRAAGRGAAVDALKQGDQSISGLGAQGRTGVAVYDGSCFTRISSHCAPALTPVMATGSG